MPAQKTAIIEELGSQTLLLPSLVNDGLLANDRIKYLLALLQAACARADDPVGPPNTLRVEREQMGIDEPALDDVVAGAVRCGPDVYSIPVAGRLFDLVRDCMEAMVRPVATAGIGDPAEIRRRLDTLLADLPAQPEQPLSRAQVDALTSGRRGAGDSLHLLVMDLHKLLNRLQADLAVETVDDARVYGLTDVDRALVAAFMRGVHSTGALRLDHPGLGTTATRYGDRLVIQNDIGQTDAHVVVITVETSAVSITYTDVHMARLQFFQSLFDAWDVAWTDTVSRRSGEQFAEDFYHLSVGTYRGEDIEGVWTFLTHLGSRLVFLIDWNRARKRLRTFVRSRDAVDLLRWAADQDVGHMAFLSVVDEHLIHEALDLVGSFPLRYAEPLHRMLGPDVANDFFRWALRTASEGVRAGTSRLALRDEVKAELAGCFRSAHEDLVAICEQHASLTVEVAGLVRDELRSWASASHDERPSAAARAKDLEHQADQHVVRLRALSRHLESAPFFDALIERLDDVVDSLEEAGFLLTLAESVSPKILEDLATMADLAHAQGRAFVRALALLRTAEPPLGGRGERRQLLEAVDGMVDLERECDRALRCAQETIVRESAHHREMYVALEVARHLEAATDAASAAAFVVRDHVLEGFRA